MKQPHSNTLTEKTETVEKVRKDKKNKKKVCYERHNNRKNSFTVTILRSDTI